MNPVNLHSLPDTWRKSCPRTLHKVYFPDGEDERVLRAARCLADEKRAVPVLVGRPAIIRGIAERSAILTSGMRIVKPEQLIHDDQDIRRYWQKNRKEGLSFEQAQQQFSDPLMAALLKARVSESDFCVAGNVNLPATVLGTVIRLNQVLGKTKLISDFALALGPDGGEPLMFAGMAMLPRPDALQLAEVAALSAQSYHSLTGLEPLVALLSFSTAGSASHELAEKVRNASHIYRSQHPDWPCAGEVQFDAALIPEIGMKKNPDSSLKRAANVFIFPSLNAGNIGIQILRNLTSWRILGPFLQGGAQFLGIVPLNTTVADLVDTAIGGFALKKTIEKNINLIREMKYGSVGND